jgi:hypothetical protein
MKSYQFRKLFNIHVRRKKILIQQKMTKIGTFEIKSKPSHPKIHKGVVM